MPISQPEVVTRLATAVPQSQLEAIAWSIRDVVDAAVPSLLRAPPGPVAESLTSGGTLTIEGTAAQPADAAETLTLTLAYDRYEPTVRAAVLYPYWELSSAVSPTAEIDFIDEPPTSGQLGYIEGTFDGTVGLTRAQSNEAGDDVDARLTLNGQLGRDDTGKLHWQVLHVSGVIHWAGSDSYYYNDASFPDRNQ